MLTYMRNVLNILKENGSSKKYLRPKLCTNAPLAINVVGLAVVVHTMKNIVEPIKEKMDTKTKPRLLIKWVGPYIVVKLKNSIR